MYFDKIKRNLKYISMCKAYSKYFKRNAVAFRNSRGSPAGQKAATPSMLI